MPVCNPFFADVIDPQRLSFQEGERLIEGFLAQVKALPLEALTEEAVKQRLGELKAELTAHNNSFVNDIVQRASASKLVST